MCSAQHAWKRYRQRISRGANQDKQRLELWKFQSNLRAQNFYMREGFNEFEQLLNTGIKFHQIRATS